MGMDCYGFVAVRKPTSQDLAAYQEQPFDDLPNEEGCEVRTLYVTPAQHHALNMALGCTLDSRPRQFVNISKLEQDFNIPSHYSYDFDVSDLTGEQGRVQFGSSKEDALPLRIGVRSSDYLYTDGLLDVDMVVREQGYIRKPFRKNLTEGLSHRENGDLVLTSDNFAGADIAAISRLLGPDVMKRCCRTFLHDDVALANALTAHVTAADLWERAVLQPLKDPLGIVEMSW